MPSMEIGGEKDQFNKYACACAVVASMISIIFGYGKIFNSILLFTSPCCSLYIIQFLLFCSLCKKKKKQDIYGPFIILEIRVYILWKPLLIYW